MQTAGPNFIFFEVFFAELKKRLDYTIGLGEYEEFLSLICSDWGLKTIDKTGELSFWAICKAMFLQYPKDEELFKTIFETALEQERERLNERFQLIMEPLKPEPETVETDTTPPQRSSIQGSGGSGASPASTSKDQPPQVKARENPDRVNPKDKYLNLYFQALETIPETGKNKPEKAAGVPMPIYNFRDSYLPISRRDMVQSWRFLRQWEGYSISREWDIEATVQQIIKDGIFLNPVLRKMKKQRSDALIIFVDRRGSMVAFHELTDVLVQAAQIDAGHTTATVYYFHNEISNVVYRRPGLTDGITLTEALRKSRPDKTVALIISDAGAARGFLLKSRIAATWENLDLLKKYVFKVVWLNPMPRERWSNTSAQYIATEVAMYPVLNAERTGFAQAVKYLAGKDLILPS